MISVSYINNDVDTLIACDPYIAFNCFIENTKNEIEDSINNFNTLSNKLMMESKVENDSSIFDLYMEKEGGNILTKIGSAIVSMFKKVIDLFTGIISKAKNLSFRNKSDLEKINAACKKNPNLASQITAAYNDGLLTVQDLKNVSEVEKAYEELIKVSKQADPESFEAKYEVFKEKAKKSDQSAGVTVARAAGAVLSTVASVFTIKKVANEISEHSDNMRRNATKFAREFNEMSTMSTDSNGNKVYTPVKGASELAKKTLEPLIGDGNAAHKNKGKIGNWTSVRNATYIMCGKYNRVISKSDKFFTRVNKIIGFGKNNFTDDEMKLMASAANRYNSH